MSAARREPLPMEGLSEPFVADPSKPPRQHAQAPSKAPVVEAPPGPAKPIVVRHFKRRAKPTLVPDDAAEVPEKARRHRAYTVSMKRYSKHRLASGAMAVEPAIRAMLDLFPGRDDACPLAEPVLAWVESLDGAAWRVNPAMLAKEDLRPAETIGSVWTTTVRVGEDNVAVTVASLRSPTPDNPDGFRCPWARCKYHLFLDPGKAVGSFKVNHPDVDDPMELENPCALAIARRGALTLEEIAALMNVTRERVRQIEGRAQGRLRWKSDPVLSEYAAP